MACARQGLEFHAESVTAGLFEPIKMQGATIRANGREGDSGSTLEIESLRLDWQTPGGFLSNPSQIFRAVWMERLHLLIDLRKGENGQTPSLAWRPLTLLAGMVSPGGAWPGQVDIENSTIELSGEATRWVLEGCSLFSSRRPCTPPMAASAATNSSTRAGDSIVCCVVCCVLCVRVWLGAAAMECVNRA